MCDSFFFLARLDVEVHAAVMILAELGGKHGEQFAQRFAVPGHQFHKEQRGNGGVAFGEVEAGANPAAFFAANQNVLFEHQLADVFEADGRFMKLAAELGGKFVDKFGDGECLGNVSWKVARSRQMPDEQCKNLVRIDKRAVAVDGADAVAISIGAQAGVELSREHRLAQCFDVWLDRFRVYAAETRVAHAANFVASDAIAPEKFNEQARGRSMHDIRDEAKFRVAQPLPIDQLFESVQIRHARLQGL